MSSSKHPKLEVKVGILTTIARSIYSDTLMKIREAVANSADNKATRFVFSLKQNGERGPYSLSLFDNGYGMTEVDIRKILKNIGYGLHRDDPNANEFYSYFGLGLMSIFQLGQDVTVITKSKQDSNVMKLKIDAKQMFSKKMESKKLAALKDLIRLDPSSVRERDTISPLSKNVIVDIFKDYPSHFTDIVVDNVNRSDIEAIMDSGFINRIRQILPLKVENRDPFLSALKESDSKKILKLLDNKEFCPTIDVLLSLDCSYYEALKKYFPDFPHAFRKNNYRIETGKDKDFTYYFLVAGKDLGVKNGHDRETGLWVRNRNFLVKPADFMSHQGMPPLISRQPLKNWIFGEVFHQKMHEFLEPSRKEYVTSDQNYREFRERLRKKLEPVVKVMEKAYDAYQAIIKEVKTPYDTLIKDDEQNPFRKLEKNLVRIEGIEIEDVVEEKADELFGKLSKIHNPHLEKCPEVISLIGKKKVTISGRMGKEENYKIIIDSGVEDESIRYDHVRQLAKALIPAMTFQQRRITLFHRGFTIIFVYCENIADAISINMEQMAIYVNIANKELKNHSISFLDVLIAAEYAYHSADPTRCQDVTTLECLDEMKETILHFLGEEYEQLSGFVDSLGSYFKGRESRDE